MEPIISTYIEEPPCPLFLIKPEANPKNLHYNPIDLERVHKVVRMFSDNGDMHLRYYTEDEWNNYSHVEFYEIGKPKKYTGLDHYTFLRYLNGYLAEAYVEEFLSDLDGGLLPFTFEELAGINRQLINALRAWSDAGHRTPFTFPDLRCDYTDTSIDEYEIESFSPTFAPNRPSPDPSH